MQKTKTFLDKTKVYRFFKIIFALSILQVIFSVTIAFKYVSFANIAWATSSVILYGVMAEFLGAIREAKEIFKKYE